MTWSQVHEFGHHGRAAVSDVGDMEWDALECVEWEWVSPHGVGCSGYVWRGDMEWSTI